MDVEWDIVRVLTDCPRAAAHQFGHFPSGRGIGFDRICIFCGVIANKEPIY